eukprot:COSAG05_NODE_101_length_19100_cov_24.260144_10_plen_57_part_00
MLVEYEFAFGETSQTGTGDEHNKLINIGEKAPRWKPKGAPQYLCIATHLPLTTYRE